MKNIKMRLKLYIIFLLTGIIPIFIISLVLFISASNELETSVLKSNTVFSSLTKDQLAAYFSERKANGVVIAASDSLTLGMEKLIESDATSLDRSNALKMIDEFLNISLEENNYTDIYITDNHGKVLYAVKLKEQLEGADLSSRDYVKGALSGKQTWSELFYSDVINENMMALSTPIYGHASTSNPIGG